MLSCFRAGEKSGREEAGTDRVNSSLKSWGERVIWELERGRAKGECGVHRPREAAGAGHRGCRDGTDGRH